MQNREQIKIKKNVLKRVRIVYTLRKVFNPLLLESFLLAGTLAGLLYMTSVTSIFKNFTGVNGLSGFFNLSISAILDTEGLVQLLFAVFIASLFFLGRDVFRRKTLSFKRI